MVSLSDVVVLGRKFLQGIITGWLRITSYLEFIS
jgi:hypothetical protein